MKQNGIWFTLLIFGALSSFMCSCGRETVDGVQYQDHIYKNATTHQLRIEGYSNKFGSANSINTWNIEPQSSAVFHFEIMMGSLSPAPVFCDSVRLEFAGRKELWYRRGDKKIGNILEYGCENKVNKHQTQFTHEIIDLVYDMATDIAD